MPTPIVATKFYIPPPQPTLIQRPHLIERLNENCHRKLTLIAAPAGFGKSTLVSEWLRQLDARAAWVSLDEGDNDLVQFLRYLVAAMQRVDATVGQDLVQVLEDAESAAFEPVLAELINDIVDATPVDATPAGVPTPHFVLVLDDYHAITAAPVHEALVYLLDHLPDGLHIVLMTRSDPPLSLARMRVRQQVHEIRVRALHLALHEVQAYFHHVAQVDLPLDAVQQLEARTEGWIAGVQLTALSLQGQKQAEAEKLVATLTGTNRYIADYLIEEVLHHQPPEIRNFLLQTSILERLSPTLCDAVTQQHNGYTVLPFLESNGFFLIPLDNERQWYRYHHLFLDLLRAQLHFQQPDQIPVLHQHAADWYARRGSIFDALRRAFAANDPALAITLMEDHTFPLILRGNFRRPLAWLKQLPQAELDQSPRLLLDYGWLMALTTEIDKIAGIVRLVEQNLADADADDPTVRQQRIEIGLLQSFTATHTGEPERGLTLSQQILDKLPHEETLWRGIACLIQAEAYYTFGNITEINRALTQSEPLLRQSNAFGLVMFATGGLLQASIIQGQLHHAQQLCQRTLAWATEQGLQQNPALAFMYVDLGNIYREWNELATAESYLMEGIRLAEIGNITAARSDCHLALTKLYMSQGDWPGAQRALDEAKATRPGEYPPATIAMNALQLRIWLQTGALHLAERWMQSSGLSLLDEPTSFHGLEYCALCRLAIAQGQLDPAFVMLDKLLQQSLADHRTTWVIEILLLKAVALHMQGKRPQALGALTDALQWAKPEGFIRSFIDEGDAVADLLRQAAIKGIEVAYVTQLLEAFQEEMPNADLEQPLVEPLSKRELELVQLVAEGLTNQQIADQLVISLATTKKHMSNILGKLAAANRTEAVGRARELNLI